MKEYADRQNLSVDDFVDSLIKTLSRSKNNKKKYKMLPIYKLNSDLQMILNLPKATEMAVDDINGDGIREEYLKDKYGV